MKPTFIRWLNDKSQKVLKDIYKLASGNWYREDWRGGRVWEFAPTLMFYAVCSFILINAALLCNFGSLLGSIFVIWTLCLVAYLKGKYRSEVQDRS